MLDKFGRDEEEDVKNLIFKRSGFVDEMILFLI